MAKTSHPSRVLRPPRSKRFHPQAESGDTHKTAELLLVHGPVSDVELEARQREGPKTSKLSDEPKRGVTQEARKPSVGRLDVYRDGLATNARIAGAYPMAYCERTNQ